MAAPITHIALADSIFDTYFEGKSRRLFMIGTLFPSIEYLRVLGRDRSHFRNIHVSELISQNSFSAGFKFHSLVDQIRDEFLESHAAYYSFPKNDLSIRALKFLEDDIFYDMVSNWSEYCSYFEGITDEERKYGIDGDAIMHWHKAVSQYCRKKPTDEVRIDFVQWLGFSQEVAKETNDALKEMRNDAAVVEMIKDLYRNFKYLIDRT
jgi:hypothetical protein